MKISNLENLLVEATFAEKGISTIKPKSQSLEVKAFAENSFVDFTMAENNVKGDLVASEKPRRREESVMVSATMYQAGVKDDFNARHAGITRAKNDTKRAAEFDCVASAIARVRS